MIFFIQNQRVRVVLILFSKWFWLWYRILFCYLHNVSHFCEYIYRFSIKKGTIETRTETIALYFKPLLPLNRVDYITTMTDIQHPHSGIIHKPCWQIFGGFLPPSPLWNILLNKAHLLIDIYLIPHRSPFACPRGLWMTPL